jgi:hypothetical protein
MRNSGWGPGHGNEPIVSKQRFPPGEVSRRGVKMTTTKSPAGLAWHREFRLIKTNGDYISFTQADPQPQASDVPKAPTPNSLELCRLARVGPDVTKT